MKIRRQSSHHDAQALLDFGDRVVNGDTPPPTTDLESTYLRVQRAMRANQPVPHSMPDHLRMRAWEDIMQTTAIAPVRGSTRPGNRPRAIPAVPLSRMAWTSAANIALALLVVIAGFGAWRAFDGGISGGGNGPAPSEGRYAQAPTTPVPMATAETYVTAKPISSCDFSENIPIFTAVEYTEYTGAALYLWKDQSLEQWSTGDLVLHCDGQNDTVLAEDVYNASPGPIQGVVALHQFPDPATAPESSVTTYLDLISGKSVSFGSATQSMTLANAGADYVRSEWVIGVSVSDASVFEIANLRTMDSHPFSDFSDVVPSERSSPWAVATGDTMVIGFRSPFDIETTEGDVLTGLEMSGDMLVIKGDFSKAHWISVPDELGAIREAWLSPNGDYLAVAAYSGDSIENEQRSYAILGTTDGRLISQSQSTPRYDNAYVTWVQDGSAIVFTQQHSLVMLRAEPNGAPQVLLEADGELRAPRSTYDDATVVVQEYPVQDQSGEAISGSYAVHIVATDSGDVVAIEGRDINDMMAWIPSVNALAMVMPEAPEPTTTTIRFYDAVTGQHIEDVKDVPYPFPTTPSGTMLIGTSSIVVTPNGNTTLLTIGSQFMFLTSARDGEVSVRHMPPPPEPHNEGNPGMSVTLSDDGQMASAVRTNDEAQIRFIMDLTDTEAEWLEVPTEEVNTSPNVTFVQAP